MATIMLNIPDILVDKVGLVAQSRGFSDSETWISSLVLVELKAYDAAVAMTPFNEAKQAAMDALDQAIKGTSWEAKPIENPVQVPIGRLV